MSQSQSGSQSQTQSSASAPSGGAGSKLLQGYKRLPGTSDELIGADGQMRPVWAPLIKLLEEKSPEALRHSFAAGDQYLHDAGVYFRQHTETGSTERNWPLSHIPVVISGAEWAKLTDGITQRADLLERVMADLYGPANLVRNGLLPAELVAQNPEWLRPIVGMKPRSGHFLHFLAFELGRSPDGSWLVLGDRTQAPSGAGFALENRMATTRIFADHYATTNVERIADFFRQFRNALNGLRANPSDGAAILTPGPETDTYFEHAYIARYLGYALLESEDLVVEDGRLLVRTIEGAAPISVLWRRLDSRFADPLELDETSAIGTPGMVSALREQALSMVNCLGSGVLESRALLAFLPRICQSLTGEALRLPNIATWWCGQKAERDYVRRHLERMMIGSALSNSLPFAVDETTVLGGEVRGNALSDVQAWIEGQGPRLVGQEAVSLSTTPAMIDGTLQPRPMTVRVFAARTPEGWTVMPGGYARIGRTEDPTALAMRNGGSVADVWVMGDGPVKPDTLKPKQLGPFARPAEGVLPARAADNLFWLGRYVERAEGVTRLARAYHLRLAESGSGASPLMGYIGQYMGAFGVDPTRGVPKALVTNLTAAKSCAAKVRDRFSTDGWVALYDLARMADTVSQGGAPGDEAARALTGVLRELAGFSGLVHENMFRLNGWRFLMLGRALERADAVCGLVASCIDEGAPNGALDLAVEVADSVMTHRRRYTVETNRNTVVDLLVLDPDNPRSVRFQIDQLRAQQADLPTRLGRPKDSADLVSLITGLQQRLDAVAAEGMGPTTLASLRADILRISDALTALYLG